MKFREIKKKILNYERVIHACFVCAGSFVFLYFTHTYFMENGKWFSAFGLAIAFGLGYFTCLHVDSFVKVIVCKVKTLIGPPLPGWLTTPRSAKSSKKQP